MAVVEAEPSVRDALSVLVESAGHEARCFSCLEKCLDGFDAEQMGAIVVGAERDGAHELDQLMPLLDEQPAARVILLTDGSPTALVVKAMRAGVSNLLEHPFSYDQLRVALDLAVNENHEQLQAERKRLPSEISQRLSPQEADIAMLLIGGAATKEIAAKLDLSVRTIHYRKNAIFEKIGAENREQAIKLLTP